MFRWPSVFGLCSVFLYVVLCLIVCPLSRYLMVYYCKWTKPHLTSIFNPIHFLFIDYHWRIIQWLYCTIPWLIYSVVHCLIFLPLVTVSVISIEMLLYYYMFSALHFLYLLFNTWHAHWKFDMNVLASYLNAENDFYA